MIFDYYFQVYVKYVLTPPFILGCISYEYPVTHWSAKSHPVMIVSIVVLF